MVAHFTMRTHGVNQADLLKAFGYIERVVKFGFFFVKRPCLHQRALRGISNHLI